MSSDKKHITILAIESSCDDTSAAVIRDGLLLSNVTASQKVHEEYGGVVPELASRAHQQNIVPVVDAAALGTQIVYSSATLVTATAREDGEIRKAVDALINKGCDVIISYTESAETVEYCNKKGVKVIGNLDYSENAGDYENLLMYFYSSRDSFYLSQYKSMQLGEWQPESYMGTLGNGVVNVSDALPAAKDGTQDIMNKLIPKVASGAAYIFNDQLKDVNGTIMQREGVTMATSDILSLNWYVLGVDLSLDSFIESKSTPDSSELVIKK